MSTANDLVRVESVCDQMWAMLDSRKYELRELVDRLNAAPIPQSITDDDFPRVMMCLHAVLGEVQLRRCRD